MLIDKLKRDFPDIVMVEPLHKLKNAITFFIDETGNDFDSRNLTATPLELPSKFPFENIFLQLQKIGLWIVSTPECFYISSFLQTNEIPYSFLIEGFSPRIFYKGFVSNNNITGFMPIGVRDIASELNLKPNVFSGIFMGHVRFIVPFLNILSCKNVRSKKIISHRKKKYHKKPLFSYYILQICTGNNSTPSEDKNLWSNRVHLCRGHVKTYTKNKPLFGKYVGNVWCPQHARGDKSKGVIHKDYSIESGVNPPIK